MGWRLRLDNLEFDRLNAEEASSLEDPFEEREVWEVIKGMDRDKAPSPNGFTLAFFQDCWGVVKGFLRLSLSIKPSRPTSKFPFLGRVFGDQRLLREWRFLRGRPLVIRSSP
jgi:hypothetical protein